VDTIARVRRAFHVQGWSVKKIVWELHVSRNTVRKILRSDETDFSYERERQPLPKTGAWKAEIQSHQPQHARQKALRLAQPQAEYEPRVRAVSIARSEQRDWPPLVLRRGAAQPSIASDVTQRVRLPRWRRPASYSAQFVTLNFILPM
jgi:hypothetical protein